MENNTFIIGSDKTKNVIVSEHNRLVNFSFAEPRALLARRKYFDGHILTAPPSTPYLIS
jgi:hypothetical protein